MGTFFHVRVVCFFPCCPMVLADVGQTLGQTFAILVRVTIVGHRFSPNFGMSVIISDLAFAGTLGRVYGLPFFHFGFTFWLPNFPWFWTALFIRLGLLFPCSFFFVRSMEPNSLRRPTTLLNSPVFFVAGHWGPGRGRRPQSYPPLPQSAVVPLPL